LLSLIEGGSPVISPTKRPIRRPMHRIQCQITQAQMAGLRAMAERTELPLAELVRRGLDDLLEREAEKDRPVRVR
jgi:hypothetical protein